MLEWLKSYVWWRVPDDLEALRRQVRAERERAKEAAGEISYEAQNGFGHVVAQGVGLMPYDRTAQAKAAAMDERGHERRIRDLAQR